MIYDLIAPFYDEVNRSVDYAAWGNFIEEVFRREYHAPGGKPELVLDVGCGTGRMTHELASRGYDMTGVDNSPEMLDVARRATRASEKEILWLCQDMTELDLYGTVDAAVCCLDTLNHLTEPEMFLRALQKVHLFLIPNGLFLFDLNGKFTFENRYADEAYPFETKDAFCVWQNHYHKSTKLCDFEITVFQENADGSYRRYDDFQQERMYTVRAVKTYLEKAGFAFIGAYADFAFTPATDESPRIYFVARAEKDV